MAMKSQLEEIYRMQKELQLSVKASHPQAHLMDFLMEQLSMFEVFPFFK
jgi:hypothetical protein